MTYQLVQRRNVGRGLISMRGRALGGGMGAGPLPVGVGIWAVAGNAVARTEKPEAQTIAITPVRVIA
jgi:hypothetical protein